jgi:RHS repeat-associated protein
VYKNETKSVPIPPYFYDGNLLLAEKIGSQIQKIYINDGQGIVGMVRPIYNESNTLTHYQRLYYLYDALGSVSAVTGEHGLPLQNYTYSPFGTCLNVTNDPINSLQFVGRYGGYLDSDTGLTYFWHRWYDSKDGRWISRDPIKNIQRSSSKCQNKRIQVFDQNTINLYHYTYNRPTKFIDYNGLDCESDYNECLEGVIERFTEHETYLLKLVTKCIATCLLGSVVAGPAYPELATGCSAACMGIYTVASAISSAATIGQTLGCVSIYFDCNKKKECKR